jgi:hypothetical protein
VIIESDDVVAATGPAPQMASAAASGSDEPPGDADAVDAGPETGPTAGAEQPSLPGSADDPVTADTTSSESD